MSRKKRLFVDMDGTLAEYRLFSSEEQYFQDGYYLSLKPFQNVVDAIRHIIKNEKDIEVYALSAYPQGSNAKEEKDKWLDNHLPELRKENRIYTLCGQSKRNFIKGGITKDDYLLDDYTVNLKDWDTTGVGIKLLNGLNSRSGEWSGSKISYKKEAKDIAKSITDIVLYGEKIKDDINEIQLRNETHGFTIYITKEELSDIINKYFPKEFKSVDDFRKRFTLEDWNFVKRVATDAHIEENTSLKQFEFEYKTLSDQFDDTLGLLRTRFIKEMMNAFSEASFDLYTVANDHSDQSAWEIKSQIEDIDKKYRNRLNLWKEYKENAFHAVNEKMSAFLKKYEDKMLHENKEFKTRFEDTQEELLSKRDSVFQAIEVFENVGEKEYIDMKNEADNRLHYKQSYEKRTETSRNEKSLADNVLEDEEIGNFTSQTNTQRDRS